jgi:hypothetical protein
LFLDVLFGDFFAALNLLIRRAKNDYTEDTYPLQFPPFIGSTQAALSPWTLFEQWVAAKKPARATVDRWRGVFLRLAENFSQRNAGVITGQEAQEWADGLVTSERTPRTVRDVWLVATRTVFGWAKDRKLILNNQFADVKVSVPRGQLGRETKAFRTDELTKILKAASAVSDTTKAGLAARRWVPWLCAYTGARVGNQATARRRCRSGRWSGCNSDHAGSWFGQDPEDEGRSLAPTPSGARFPFVGKDKGERTAILRPRSGRPATDDPTNPRKPRYVKAREHLADWVRRLGVDDRELQPNHAWRHTFKQIAARAGISDRISDYITGHSQKSVGASYGASHWAIWQRH